MMEQILCLLDVLLGNGIGSTVPFSKKWSQGTHSMLSSEFECNATWALVH